MDHGELNLPLSKRADTLFGLRRVDVERAQREQERAAVAQRKADKATAKELFAKHADEIVAKHGARFGEKALRDQLDQWAKWEPKKLIAFVAKFQAEAA